jgi:manganese/zinc/iron transport system substrate-binding protein
MKKLIVLALSLLVVSVISGCTSATTGNESDKIHVTTTIAQIQDVVNNIGGDHVETESLMGPGIDPHLYQASQGDISKLTKADIIFYSGLHLEGKMGEVFEKVSKDRPTIAVAEKISEDELLADPNGANAHDPHVWFSVPLWIQTVDTIEEELGKLKPEFKEEFAENAKKYKAELEELDQYARDQFKTIPEGSRVLVTAHDAFGYFGHEYGFEVMGLQGISTDSEYGLKDVQNLVDILVDKQIKAVFVESSISEKSINAVVEGANEQNHQVSIGGELYSDAMGEAGTKEGTYIGMFKHNIDTIVSSLK